jgi:hypothetical protein
MRPPARIRRFALVGVAGIGVAVLVGLIAGTTGLGRGPARAVGADASSAGPKLLIRLDVGRPYAKSGFGPQHVADFLSDGSVVRWASTDDTCRLGFGCGVLERNRLTPSGLASLQALLSRDADLLAGPADFESATDTGIDDILVLERPDGSRYTIDVPSPDHHYPGAIEQVRPPEVARLTSLARTLSVPTAVADLDWQTYERDWQTYTPARMAVFVTVYDLPELNPNGFGDRDHSPVLTGWPFDGNPETFGGAFDDNPVPDYRQLVGRTSSRCAFLRSEEVESALTTLTSPSNGKRMDSIIASGDRARTVWRWSDKSPTTGVEMRIVGLLPEDTAGSCIDAISQ